MIHLLKLEELVEKGKLFSDTTPEYIKLIEIIFNFFKMQDSFQQKAMAKKEWYEVTELNNKPVNYGIAMLGEIGEGIASLDFKWWSGLDEEDKENFITELIDALHFELSKTMQNIYIVCKNLELTEEKKKWLMDQIFMRLVNSIANSYGLEGSKIKEAGPAKKLDLIEYYIMKSISLGFEVSAVGKFISVDDSHLKILANNFSIPLYSLLHVLNSFDVSILEAYDRYVLKNALNNVRKMNGYKEGIYIKHWLSPKGYAAEDNTVALEITKGLFLSLEDAITTLDTYYKDMVIDSALTK